MTRLRLLAHRYLRPRGPLVEAVGLVTTAMGIYQLFPPAALIFAGAALVFIAQGMDADE